MSHSTCGVLADALGDDRRQGFVIVPSAARDVAGLDGVGRRKPVRSEQTGGERDKQGQLSDHGDLSKFVMGGILGFISV